MRSAVQVASTFPQCAPVAAGRNLAQNYMEIDRRGGWMVSGNEAHMQHAPAGKAGFEIEVQWHILVAPERSNAVER